MIRFACPGCNATFSVGDEKAGKTGKCPKCQSQFVIPEAEGGPAPASPPPPPPPVSDDVEIAPCPGCQARLSVSVADLGVDVECPYCKTVYKAKRPGAALQQLKPRSATSEAPSSVDADRPSRPRRPRDDEEEAPRSRRRDRDDEDDDTRPSRRRRDEDEEEDEEDRPKRKKRRRRSAPETSSAATTATTLGIIGLFVWCCPLLGLVIGILAIKYGVRAKQETDGAAGNGGLIMGGICLGLSFINAIVGVIMQLNK